jgi:hypothetical protein
MRSMVFPKEVPMSDSRPVRKVLLLIVLLIGACGGATATSARSKDAGAGGVTTTGGAGPGGTAVGTAGVAAGGAVGTAGVAAGGAVGTAGVAAGGAVGTAGVAAGGAVGTAGVAAGGAVGTGGTGTGGATATGGADASTTDACVGSCVPAVCAAGTSICVDNAVATCNSDGSGFASPVACGTNESCAVAATTATCKTRLCTPGAKTCQANAEKVVTCSENGLEQDATDDCGGKSQICAGGACVPVVCAAGTTFCSGKDLRACSAKGDSSTLVDTCATIPSCNAATTSCAGPRICTPNQPVCNGSIATTCNADGTGYLAGGTACADAGKACHEGACTVCWPTTYFCSGSAVRQCAAGGMSSVVYRTCASSEYCDSATAACKAQVCAPNQPVCNGNTATTCNAEGSDYAAGGTSCNTSAPCVQHDCIAVGCGTLSGLVCLGSSSVGRCQSGGMTYFERACGRSEYCESGACKALVCVPNRPSCDGNTATVCSANGSRHASGGTPCGAQRCVEGACQDALFVEDFEDGDFAGWQASPAGKSGYTVSATTTDGAAGTLHSLMQKKTSTGPASFDGIYQTFADLKPKRISWWVMTASTTAASGGFSLSASAVGTSDWIAFSYFKEDGMLMLLYETPASSVAIPYSPNVWYHIELRNLDWTAKTFDYYVNGALLRAAAPFRTSSATVIRRLDLFNPTNATVYWDQITFE